MLIGYEVYTVYMYLGPQGLSVGFSFQNLVEMVSDCSLRTGTK